jgi:hypothetical protein
MKGDDTMVDKTVRQRMDRMRESNRKWLEKFAYGLSAEGLIGALKRGEAQITWIKKPEKKVSKKK